MFEGRYPALKNIFAVPNAAKRSVRLASMLRSEGMVSGIPDILLTWPQYSQDQPPCIRYCGLALEMKTKGGKVSDTQKDWLARLEAASWRTAVCWSSEEAWAVVCTYLGIDVAAP